MEWVETTAKTIDEAKDLALDKLGVDEIEAEFEVLEEPKQGLFGRTRGQARVRARVQPKSPRPKNDRRDKRRKASSRKSNGKAGNNQTAKTEQEQPKSTPKQEQASKSKSPNRDNKRSASPKREDMNTASIEEVQTSVGNFLEGLVSAFGYESATTITEVDGALEASIDGKHGLLVGPKGRTLEAVQELTRITAQREAPSSVRIRVDVGGYRAMRREALEAFAISAADTAVDSGSEVVLEPMSSLDRKVLHDALNDHGGVVTKSAGNEPRRRVIIVPNGSDQDTSEEE